MTTAKPIINFDNPPKKLPFLESICWQTRDVYRFTPEEMLNRYERGWRYRDIFNNLESEELDFIRELAAYYKSWLVADFMNFRLAHHNNILTVLQCLNCDVLENGSAYFGGGSVIALNFDEYRVSKDIDFIACVGAGGYKYLRSLVFDNGYEALFNDLSKIEIGRITTDQYGIRMNVLVNGVSIKTEIIAETRFHMDSPIYPSWSPVPCLSLNDCFTSKLLANSDRYIDKAVESRDLIDLAVLRLQSLIPKSAIDKAENNYEVIKPLKRAIELFQKNPEYRQKCFQGLQVVQGWIPKIIDGIDLLASDFDLSNTQRLFKEQHD
jgi:Nucleotidyl transferase AbiEii toxin, Type IV TA system